jgi:hypothetical protein
MKMARWQRLVFRKPVLTVISSCGIGLMVGGFSVLVLQNVKGAFGAAVVASAFVYLFWLLGWQSAVRFTLSGVIVDNLLIRHVIPWAALANIGVKHGLTFNLRDGRSVVSIMYGGSVIGGLFGYRYTRSVAERMCSERDELLNGQVVDVSSEYRSHIHFSPWPPLIILISLEAITAVLIAAK